MKTYKFNGKYSVLVYIVFLFIYEVIFFCAVFPRIYMKNKILVTNGY
jgi:hypothetical protein